MKQPQLRITTVASIVMSLAPLAAFAHPGHADGVPVAHATSHLPHFLVALLAVGIWGTQAAARLVAMRFTRKRLRH